MSRASSRKPVQSVVQTILRLMRDRRGVSALMFLVSSVGFMGMAGFGMEVSTWYLERRHGQNTADAAAIAGVLALIQSGTFSSAQTAGINVATDNAYTSGSNQTTVTIQPGTYGGSFSADASGTCSPSCNAVRATIVRSIPRSFTALVMGSGSTNVTEVATAELAPSGPACSLALGGGLGFSGSAAVSATDCTLASNKTGPQSISFNGAGANKKQANAVLVGSGGCTQSGSGSPCTQQGNLMYQPPSLDPYQALKTDPPAIPSAVNSTNCGKATTNVSDPKNPPYPVSSGVWCVGQVPNITNGTTVSLASGTWFFYGKQASINITGGSFTCPGGGCTIILYDSSLSISSGSLNCSGCTIVLTGDSASNLGSLSINGGTVNMSAPKTSPYLDSNYNGILFYMDYRYPEQKAGSCGSTQVTITGSSSTTLNGGMYFPNASVCVTGNAFSTAESCFSLVAWSVYYNGNATETLSGCSTTGTQTAQVRAVNLVQ